LWLRGYAEIGRSIQNPRRDEREPESSRSVHNDSDHPDDHAIAHVALKVHLDGLSNERIAALGSEDLKLCLELVGIGEITNQDRNESELRKEEREA
jgi:hypothetical protein